MKGKIHTSSIERKYIKKNNLFLDEYKSKIEKEQQVPHIGFTDSGNSSISHLDDDSIDALRSQ